MFNFTNTKDRSLFEEVFKESIDIYGISIEYFVVEFDDTKETLYAEDTKALVTEKYDMMAYGQYIDEIFELNKFGIQSFDVFELIISKSKFTEITGSDPKEGDMVRVNYMDRIFRVTSAKEEENIYLQQKYSWKLVLNPADFDGTEVTPNIGVPDFETEEATFDDNSLIDELSEDIVIEDPDDTNPFADWD